MSEAHISRIHICYCCHKPLSDDLKEFTIAILEDAMEKLGIFDNSEIRDDDKVLVELCLPCARERGCSMTAQEMRDRCEEIEKSKPVN